MKPQELYRLRIHWGTSRGRDTYGYTTCTLYVDGKRRAGCNGGGYDMKGTAIGHFIASEFAEQLRRLKVSQMPEHSHWERAENPRRVCRNTDCIDHRIQNNEKDCTTVDGDTCPICSQPTEPDYNDGKTVKDGRYFYGLSFHDPNYDPGKAVPPKAGLGREKDNTEGKTIDQLEKEGESFGLDRYQAFYSASSKIPTKRHTVPLIDGACGLSSVETIIKSLGYELAWISETTHDTTYTLQRKARSKKRAA